MDEKELIKYDLESYARSNNKSIKDAIDYLIAIAPQSTLAKYNKLPKVIKAWKILKLQYIQTTQTKTDILKVDDSLRNNNYYDGSAVKFGITLNAKDYIIKFTKDNDLSVVCEYIASNFIQSLGIDCQTVLLGEYESELVAVIEDFTHGCCLHTFKDTKQSSVDTDLSDKEYTYEDVLYLINKHLKLTSEEKYNVIVNFWKMYICDSILGNRDRHWGNWGYIENSLGYYKMAPLFDNGGSLYPGVLNVIDQYSTDRKTFLHERIFTVPASLFKIQEPDRTHRTNYYEILSSHFNSTLDQQLDYFRSTFTYDNIYDKISELVFSVDINLPINVHLFWVEVTTLRYMCLILQMDFEEAFSIIDRRLHHDF